MVNHGYSFYLFCTGLRRTPSGLGSLVGMTNGVEVAQKTIEGSDLFAFRGGEAYTDVHVSVLSALLLNIPRARVG